MKLAIVLLACLGLVAAASLTTPYKGKFADKDFLLKQKFLFEIVYRVEDPLMFEDYIKLGKDFTFDQSFYTQYDIYMEKFLESYKMGALLPKGEFFGALVKTHHKQAWGLFNFFYFAKDFETFKQNVAWARMHVNEGMFVYALTLAVIHRDDTQGLILPSIQEIFPQYFFNSQFIFEAEKFNYDVWSKYIMYEKELYDIYYRNNKYSHDDYVYVKDWKVWQWWSLMGLGQHWYQNDEFILRENAYKYEQDSKLFAVMKNIKKFWMPVDYTRDIEIFNEHSQLSYFTEDFGLNAYWYYLNMDYAFFLDGKTFGLNKDRRGEWYLFNVQQILARYYMERLSNGFGEIPDFARFSTVEYGYDPELIAYNGVGFSYRKNYYEFATEGNMELFNSIELALNRIENVVATGYYQMRDGTVIDMRAPESIEFIGNLLQGNIDAYDKFFFTYWNVYAHMLAANVNEYDFEVNPNVFLNFETMMRDPMFYMMYQKIADVYYRFQEHLTPYTREELNFQGVELKNVDVSDLVTYFDLVDSDVSNLLNDQMVFVDGEFVCDKALFARQMRLNHKPFTFKFNVESDKSTKVVIRTFLAPKFDEFGRMLSLNENRQNYFQLDAFTYDLVSGKNVIERTSEDFMFTIKDRTTYTELYQGVMLALEGKFDFPIDISQPHSGVPDRLILPRGWKQGMPMQMFFIVTPLNTKYEQYDFTFSSGIGSGMRYIDNMPFGYPFDRTIEEFDFYVPNMYFKDVEIYHINSFEAYFKKGYESTGKFDYYFFNNYYTKFFNH